MRRYRAVLGAAVMAVLITGCTQEPDEGLTAEPTAVASPSPTATAAPTDDDDTEQVEAFRRAVTATAEAPQRSFTAEVRATTSAGEAVVTLSGTRDGDRRTLRVGSGEQAVTYVVTADGATVDAGAGPEPIALDEVPGVPGLEALGQLDDLRVPEPGLVIGTLPEVADASGGAVDGPIAVNVTHAATIEEVVLRGPDGGYTATIRFDTPDQG